ncbi:MAG TPA: Wzz/FepE/Etk N-terminal domain-containing protein [Thermoleophilia bacterium]|nr:Wzz/FepE/Etk N-terminal domain-containing protein [Thermoleophilia bacterium]
MDSEETAGLSLRQYAAVLRRHVWLIVIVTLVATVGAYLYSNSKTRLYEASTQVMYDPPISTSQSISAQARDPLSITVELQNIGNEIANPEVYNKVVAVLGADTAPYSVSASAVIGDAMSSYSTTASITAQSPDPETAAKAANAYAAALIQWRKDNQVKQLEQAIAVVQPRVDRLKTSAPDTTEYFIAVSRLTDLLQMKETANGDYRVIVPASVPAVPIYPRPQRSAIMGFGVGLILALGVAFVLEQFDVRIRSHREVSETLHLPTVGRIPKIPAAELGHGPLISLTEPGGTAAESLRVLRSNLEFFNLDRRLRSLVIVSAHKSEGKTLTACNLALTIALAGKTVVLIDGDLRRPRVHQAFDLKNEVGVSTVLSGKTALVDALQPYRPPELVVSGNGNAPPTKLELGEPGHERLVVLTSGPLPPNPGEMVASQRFEGILKELTDASVDYVLVDTPAFRSVGDAAALAARVDGLLYLANIETLTKPELEEAREFLEPLPCRKLGVIAVSEKFAGGGDYYYRRH